MPGAPPAKPKAPRFRSPGTGPGTGPAPVTNHSVKGGESSLSACSADAKRRRSGAVE